MNRESKPHSDPLLELLREHLERQEGSLEIEPLATRIIRLSRSQEVRPLRRLSVQGRVKPRSVWVVWALGMVSLLVSVSVLGWLVFNPSNQVQAEQAIRQAEELFQLPLERSYLVEVRPENGNAVEEHPLPIRKMRLWAAGDKFRVEVTGGNFRWAWGRQSDGTVWIAWYPHRGLRIAPDEQGPALRWACELFSLRPEALLSHILAHCRLREDFDARKSHRRIIYAEPRPWSRQTWLRRAIVELDPESKAVLKLTLTRVHKHSAATSMVTFTLIEVRPVEHLRYELEGNLTDPFQILDRHFQPDRRRRILSRLVGPNVDAWFLSKQSKASG